MPVANAAKHFKTKKSFHSRKKMCTTSGSQALTKFHGITLDHLVEESKKHLVFLETLHFHSISIRKPSLDTFRRYSELWLPLIHAHEKRKVNGDKREAIKKDAFHADFEEGLIPPADIAWLWHCHRLAPYRYAKHVQDFLYKSDGHDKKKDIPLTKGEDFVVFDPKFPFVVQFEDNVNRQNATFNVDKHGTAAEYTQQLWKQMYPNEPFVGSGCSASSHDTAQTANNHTCTKLSGFDVMESCQRQATFLWQVSGDNYQDDTFLRQGVENYLKFLKLMKRGGGERPRFFLVPTYQIDLIWHTHILYSIRMYHWSCMDIIGTYVTIKVL